MSFAKIEITIHSNANVVEVFRLMRELHASPVVEEINYEVD